MAILSRDTSPEVERFQIELMRQAGPTRRFALARSLSQFTLELTRRSIRRRHPDASEEEIGLIVLSLYHGRELAEQVRAHLARRRSV
jgi:hypothetical protein